jgi:hypothetical protein
MNAADRQRVFVEGLQAKIHLLEQSVATQRFVLQDRDAEIARLRAALKPFAEFAKALDARFSDDETKLDALAKIYDAPELTVGDCRAALKALEEA